MEIKQKLTPAMQQYVDIKNRYPDCIIMFRMGDFYEMFFEDAKIASRVLEITLTKRGKAETAVPLAGLPYHSLDQYVAKFIRKGFKVVIVEQMEDPKKAKGLVKRDVVRIITPGTLLEDNLLDNKSNNYIASFLMIKENFAISFADLSTGEFITTVLDGYESLYDELAKFKPSEIIIPVSFDNAEQLSNLKSLGYFVNHYDDRFFWQQSALSTMQSHFEVTDLNCFGISNDNVSVLSSGALLSYLRETQLRKINNIVALKYYNTTDFMVVDRSTIRNLEILSNITDNSKKGTLLNVLDNSKTSMGGRLLKKWLVQPLLEKAKIDSRHTDVDILYKDL